MLIRQPRIPPVFLNQNSWGRSLPIPIGLKPFSLKELLSRIKAILRRSKASLDSAIQSKYICDDLEVDVARNRVFLSGKEINLGPKEYKILAYLVLNAGKIITPDQSLLKIWGEDYFGNNHIVQVGMARLRKSLPDNRRQPKYI